MTLFAIIHKIKVDNRSDAIVVTIRSDGVLFEWQETILFLASDMEYSIGKYLYKDWQIQSFICTLIIIICMVEVKGCKCLKQVHVVV